MKAALIALMYIRWKKECFIEDFSKMNQKMVALLLCIYFFEQKIRISSADAKFCFTKFAQTEYK